MNAPAAKGCVGDPEDSSILGLTTAFQIQTGPFGNAAFGVPSLNGTNAITLAVNYPGQP